MEKLSYTIPGMSALPSERENPFQSQVDNFNSAKAPPGEYNCSLCSNRGGFLYLNRQGYKVFRPCSCTRIRSSITMARTSGMEEQLRQKTFETFRTGQVWQKKLLDAAREYLKHPGAWFALCGQSGSGKTHLCSAICRELIRSGQQVRYMRWMDVAPRLKDLDLDAEIRNREKESYKTVPVLYIDDLLKVGGNDRPSRAELSLALEIVNYRYSMDLPTVLSTELSTDALMDLDQALGGRIREKCDKFFLNISPDPRKNFRLHGV